MTEHNHDNVNGKYGDDNNTTTCYYLYITNNNAMKGKVWTNF